jgi:hypothetical protein
LQKYRIYGTLTLNGDFCKVLNGYANSYTDNGTGNEVSTVLKGVNTGDGNNWIQISNYTQEPLTTSTITTTSDLTSSVFIRQGLKYKLLGDANYYYGIVENITSNTITICGVPLSANIVELYYGGIVEVLTYEFTADTFTSIGINKQISDGNIPIKTASGYIVKFETWQLTEDTGGDKAKLKVMNGANHIYSSDADGITLSGDNTFNNSGVGINKDFYYFTGNTVLRFDVTDAGSNLDTVQAVIHIYQLLV